jgi:4-hydroxy-4-methyl-2-oxoglutarate aldolase
MIKEDLTDKIIEYIEENRVSSTEVADVLNKTGEVDIRLKGIVSRIRAVGRVYYVPAYNESNWHTHYFLQDVPKKHVIYVEGINCGNRAIFGSIVSKYCILYKQAKGLVVSGNLRDMHTLVKEQYPIWCWGTTPIGCFNKDNGFDEESYEKRKAEFDGGIMVADDSGVVFIKKEQLTNDFLNGLIRIEELEDIWFDCIDRLKYSTFETICLKKYKDNDDTRRK